MLLPAFFPTTPSANSDVISASRQCVALRSTVLLHADDKAKQLLFASRDMSGQGLDSGIANDGFKAIELVVMHFDFIYEAVAMGGKPNATACYDLTLLFDQGVNSYADAALVSGEIPR